MARDVLSIRLSKEDRALLKAMADAHTKLTGALRPATVTDIVRWAVHLGAAKLGVEVPVASRSEPAPAQEPEDAPVSVETMIDLGQGKTTLTAAPASEPEVNGTHVSPASQPPVEEPPKPPEPKKPVIEGIPDNELDEMLKGV